MNRYFLPLTIVLLSVSAAHAADERAENLYRQLRCITCQSQSIADSNAPLAKDIRRLVDHEIESGKTDEQILGQLAERYGDAILMTPPLNTQTAALWYGPLLFLIIGGLLTISYFRRTQGKPS